MTEKKIIIDGLELHYKGLFDLDSFLKEIDGSLAARGYEKAEKRRHETVRPEGKDFSIELRPTKAKNEYTTLMIKLRIHISNITDATVMKEGINVKLQKGDVSIIFDAWIITDLRFRWEQKPIYYFLLMLVDHFIYKFHTDRYNGEVIEDTHHVYDQVKANLNLHRY